MYMVERTFSYICMCFNYRKKAQYRCLLPCIGFATTLFFISTSRSPARIKRAITGQVKLFEHKLTKKTIYRLIFFQI